MIRRVRSPPGRGRAHTHALSAFESTPRLALLSPEKGSGKTRTLEVIGLVVPTPMHAVNMSAAALFRVVADKQPTLLLDEADTYLGAIVAKQHEDLRGLINAGHRRGAMVYRGEVSGKAVKVTEFPAFAAAALAGIGDLPDTAPARRTSRPEVPRRVGRVGLVDRGWGPGAPHIPGVPSRWRRPYLRASELVRPIRDRHLGGAFWPSEALGIAITERGGRRSLPYRSSCRVRAGLRP